MTMNFAVGYSTPYFGVDPDKITAYAQHAEDCGFEALYLPEHIALYPGAKIGLMELPPSLPYADPLDCLRSTSPARPRPTPVGARIHWSTPDGAPSTCPPIRSRHSASKA
ncbi:hypothetical protein ALI22I_30145 [Saccharothrix sp. ALI-22-I]|uniref:hypothetical protein n=1 Tax=Saccharothrix sp. ALI-22-I TaxID=1933778 RepID=UPI00097C28D6|nr:hypothetical protein [Saccharothrix sp. ALI-22-I]ONI84762.1 hypothetical protein ALI22I_30145 [Saccharothrix sp. ALI-22-I]